MIEEIFNNGNAAQINRDVSKIFIGDNEYEYADITNSEYEDIVLVAGTLIGRNTTTKEIEVFDSTKSNGAQIPRGVLNQDWTIPAGETFNVAFCVKGRVAEEMIIFGREGDTMDTVISGAIVRDRIGSDSVGLKLVGPATELTNWDNNLL